MDQLLRGIAHMLLRLEIDAPNTESLVRRAFVAAAREKARRDGMKATQSLIASITGMSRLEVRNILAARVSPGSDRPLTRINELLVAWRTNPEFLDARGRPRALEFVGRRGSFAHLVKLYGRDITSKTFRDELLSRGLATARNRKLNLKDLSNQVRGDAVAAVSDLRFVASQLDGLNLSSGRRAYSSKRISIHADDRKTVQMLKSLALNRIETALNSLAAFSAQPVRLAPKPNRRNKRLVVTATVASETGD